ncbi:hypothetical protein V8C37DRAFT_345362 [Trichoderma ceciliae]
MTHVTWWRPASSFGAWGCRHGILKSDLRGRIDTNRRLVRSILGMPFIIVTVGIAYTRSCSYRDDASMHTCPVLYTACRLQSACIREIEATCTLRVATWTLICSVLRTCNLHMASTNPLLPRNWDSSGSCGAQATKTMGIFFPPGHGFGHPITLPARPLITGGTGGDEPSLFTNRSGSLYQPYFVFSHRTLFLRAKGRSV